MALFTCNKNPDENAKVLVISGSLVEINGNVKSELSVSDSVDVCALADRDKLWTTTIYIVDNNFILRTEINRLYNILTYIV